MTVESQGFARESSTVQLLVAQPSTLNLALRVTADTTVEVEATSPELLNTTNASVGNAVDEKTVEALPMEGRNVPDLLSLQPGVLYLGHENNQTNDSRSGAVAGARSDQGNITLDGLDNNSVLGYAFTGVQRSTIDSVEEFKVTTSNNGADSGRSSGAQVNVVTRSGTNKTHGTVYEYNRNTATSANDWFNKEAEASEGLPNKPGELIRNTFGGALGGPIKRDKLYYFINFEMQRTAEAFQQTSIVPTASFRAGSISYYYNNPSGGQSVETLSPSQFASLDPHCSGNGTCPWGPGDNPNILTVFNSYPLPNGSLAGDGLNTGSYTWAAPNPTNLWTNIAKIDYAISDNHHLFVAEICRTTACSPRLSFPARRPATPIRDNTKGIRGRRNLGHQSESGQQLPCRITRPGTGKARSLQPTVGDPRQRQQSHRRNLLAASPRSQHQYSRRSSPGRMENTTSNLAWTIVSSTTTPDTKTYSFDSGSSAAGEYFDSLANTGQDLDPSAYPALGFPAWPPASIIPTVTPR